MSNARHAKIQKDLLISALSGVVEQRISNPRGSREVKFRKLRAAWAAANPGLPLSRCPVNPLILVDRAGRTNYGLFWNSRLLKLGKTVWTNPAQAVAAFHTYVARLLLAMEEEKPSVLSEELRQYVQKTGHSGVRAITHALRESGMLQVRELETIPMPPDEE